MSIDYSAEDNQKIYRTVRNFNRKVKRLQGKLPDKYIPDLISTREIKTNYKTRKQLRKQLRLLSEFGKRDAADIVKIDSGSKTTKWEYEFLTKNTNDAIKFLEKEVSKSKRSGGDHRVLRKDYQNSLKAKIKLLKRNIQDDSYKSFKARRAIITDYLKNEERLRSGYESWLEIVNEAADYAGLSRSTIRELKGKLQQLSEQEFIDLYHEQGLVKRIFEIKYTKDGDDPEDIKLMLDELLNVL